MNTKTAVVWDTDMTDEKVVSESIDWDDDLSLEDETESVLTPDRRTRVEERHYAPGGKYRGKFWIAPPRDGQMADVCRRCSENSRAIW